VRKAEERAIKLPKRQRDSETPETGGEEPSRSKRAKRPARSKGPARSKVKLAQRERKPAGSFEKAFTRVLAIIGALLVGVARLLAAGVKALAGPTQGARRRLAVWIATLSRIVTPTRGLLLAALGCALLLALSQFVDYRGISIGADAYDPGISAVAPAPEVERKELGTAHSYVMIPIALLAALALIFAVRTGRWQLTRLAVLLGLVAILVAIFIDRPAGLDEGDLNRDFTGVEAKLLGGFWMQIFAGAGLAVTSFLLAGEIKRGGAPAKRRSRKASKPKPKPKSRRRSPAAKTGEASA
jgi:hypothetical protein